MITERSIATAADRTKRSNGFSGIRSLFGDFNNLSIQVKASAASVLLLICLLGVGANAYLTSTRSAAGLRVLTNELTPKKQAFSQVSDEVFTTHLKIFRYVSWESNGVSDKLLKPLYAEIDSDLDSLSNRIAALAQRKDLSSQERATMQKLLAKWAICKSHAKDTIDVGQNDSALAAPMATMMLGETDDSFEAVNADLQNLSLAVTATVNELSDQLYSEAARTKNIIIMVTLAGFLISTFVAVVVGRSIVRPIEAVTDVMQRLSGGEVDIAIGRRDRRDEIGRMVDAIEVFRKNIIDKHAMEQTLTAELARSVEELRALAEVGQTVNSTLDLEAVLSAIVSKATQLSGTEAGSIYVFSEARREHQLRATYGMTESLIDAIKDQHTEISNVVALAIEQGQPTQTPDLRAEPPSVPRDIMLQAGYLARLIVPLLAADRIVGALVVRRQAPGEFPKNTIALLQTFAAQSVLAIQNARLFRALAASELLFRTIFENAQIGIGVLDVKTGKHLSNRAQIEMLGYNQEELSRVENWDEIVHPDDRATGAQRYGALVQGLRDSDEYTERFIRRDGKVVTASGRFTLIRDQEGNPQYVIALHEDVTQKREAEERLRAREQLFRSIFEGAQIGIGVYKIDTQEHISNRALHEMLGYTEEELNRLEQWDEISPKEERDTYAHRYEDLVKGKSEKDEYEQHFIRRDGRRILTKSRFQLLRELAGNPQCVVALTEDITERRRAEEERKRAEEELRRANFLAETALELTKAGYWHILLDGSGCYNSSPRRVALFGDFPHPDYRYRIDEFFKHAEEGDVAAANAARKAFSDAVEGKADNYDAIFAYKRPIDGRIAWGHALGRVVRNVEGKPTHMYGVSQDITDFKLLEAELVAAKETAVAATKAKSEFLANMSHEIRTPMNAVLGMTRLALKTDLTSKQRDYLTKSKAAAETLLGIINDTLDFSKIEAGKLKMERTEFRLDAALDNLSTVVSHRAQEKNLEFLVAVGKDLPDVLIGDPLRLGQVLINLANNAVKFTERGEIVVSVEPEEIVSDRIKLKFAVRDSGIGLTRDQTARLFQAFSQADSSTTRKYGGTGLGLSISKRLVELMEGNIWVESEYGRGSTFCFTAWFGVGTAVQREKVFPPGLAGIRVLVVDDNVAAREILSEMLSQFAFKVKCVSSGDEALRELAKADSSDPYRIVLMDWQMPGMDGLETSRKIKRAGNLRSLPKILMITAFDREDIRLQAQEMQIEGFLLKPVSPSVLFDTLVSLYGLAGEERAIVSAGRVDRDSPLVSGIRVLLVEDNEVNQQVAKELLESEGARVTIANHGAEAVKILTQNNQLPSFDVVLMDLQMPEMDGLTATRLLRAQPNMKDFPIIAMTAHVMADEVQRCLDAGMNDHVAKPIDPESFFATLARWTRPHQREFREAPAKATHTHNELALPEIEGVEVASGLQRIGGNRRLYRDLLVQFGEKQKSAGERIAAALDNGDRSLAERLAHSLKGAAGNLGIKNIFHSAGNLEKAIRESQSGVDKLIKELTAALDHQIQAIQEGLATTDASGKADAAQAVDPIAVSTAIARLRDLLKANDAKAPKAYATLAGLLQGRIDPLRLQMLSSAVQTFNFETALVRLNEIADQLGS